MHISLAIIYHWLRMKIPQPKQLQKAPSIRIVLSLMSGLLAFLVNSSIPKSKPVMAEKFFSDWRIDQSLNNSQFNKQDGKNNNNGSGNHNIVGDGNQVGSGNLCQNHSCNKNEHKDYSQHTLVSPNNNQKALHAQSKKQNTLDSSSNNQNTPVNPIHNHNTQVGSTEKDSNQATQIDNWNQNFLENRFSNLTNQVSFDSKLQIPLTHLKTTMFLRPNFEYSLVESINNPKVLVTLVDKRGLPIYLFESQTEILVVLEPKSKKSNCWRCLLESSDNPQSVVTSTESQNLLLELKNSLQPQTNSKESKPVPEPRTLVGLSLVGGTLIVLGVRRSNSSR